MMRSPCDKGECAMFKSHAWDASEVYLGRRGAKKSVQRKLSVVTLRAGLYADGQFWKEMFRDAAMYRCGRKVT